MDSNAQAIPPSENSDNSQSFISRYVMTLSILLIIGTTGIIIYLFVGKKNVSTPNNSSVSASSPNCTNEKIYNDVKEALLEEGRKVCYIDAKAPNKDYVFPSDIVKSPQTKNLLSLSLDGYNLSYVRDSLESLQDLKVLKLTNANMTYYLPPGIDKLKNLEELDLTGNKFSDTAKNDIRQKLPTVKVTF